MTIYPAIDIKGGRCVRLTQGRADSETVYGEDPAAVAAEFSAAGAQWVHVVDLDGAFAGVPKNLDAVGRIAGLGLKVQLGGGLRTRASVDHALSLGVARVVIGTRASESESFVSELVSAYGDRVAVGIDARDGMVAVKGWVDTHGRDGGRPGQADGRPWRCDSLIHTDVGTDGMLDRAQHRRRREAMLGSVKARVIASGGVSQKSDVERLLGTEAAHPNLDGVIVGKAIYEGRVRLATLRELLYGS